MGRAEAKAAVEQLAAGGVVIATPRQLIELPADLNARVPGLLELGNMIEAIKLARAGGAASRCAKTLRSMLDRQARRL